MKVTRIKIVQFPLAATACWTFPKERSLSLLTSKMTVASVSAVGQRPHGSKSRSTPNARPGSRATRAR